jgi:DNA-binding NtrC family response regulator
MNSRKLPVIFVVDNNNLFRELTVQYLNIAEFHEVITFSDAAECLGFIDLGPDIVVTDLHYGDKKPDGIDLLIMAKSISPKTKFIFLSSTADIESAIKTVHLGAVDFIVKSKTALNKLLIRIKQLTDFNSEISRTNKITLRLALSLAILILAFLFLVLLYGH